MTPSAWRKSVPLSQAKAAAKAGVTGVNPSRTWQRWETGERSPPLSVVVVVEDISGGQVTASSWAQVRLEFLASAQAKASSVALQAAL